MAENKYYVLSLKWSNGDHYVWWGPNNSGYTSDLNNAGVYDEEIIQAQKNYYSNKSTMPILCDVVNNGQKQVVSVADSKNYKSFGIAEHLKKAKEY